MKLIKHVSLILLLLPINHIAGQNFHGGLMTGLVGSQVAGDTYSGFDKAGVFAGGFVSWDFTKRSALQLELTYFQKGSRKNPDPENNDYESYLFRTNYLELPVLYQLKFDWFYLEAGPSVGVLFGYFEKHNEEVISDVGNYNKPARFTLQTNIGFRFKFREKFGLGFRYNFSLLNIRTRNVTGDVWRLWGYGQFHDALVLSFFYQFR